MKGVIIMKRQYRLSMVLLFLSIALVISGCSPAVGAHYDKKIGKTLMEYNGPQNYMGESLSTEYLLQSAVVEAKGNDVDSEQLNAPLTGGITMWVGSDIAMVNSVPTKMPAAPFVENGIFFFPVEFTAKTLGWDYSYKDGIVTIAMVHDHERPIYGSKYPGGVIIETKRCRESVQFEIGSRTMVVNSEDCIVSGDYRIFQPGDPVYTAVDENYISVIRDGVVFAPADFVRHNADLDMIPYSFFSEEQFPDGGYVIFSGKGKENGIGGFYVWDEYDALPEELRGEMNVLGVVGESRDAYDVVEYGKDGLIVHVMRLQEGKEDLDGMDGQIHCVSVTDPAIATPRGLRCGENKERIMETYDSTFYQNFQCTLKDDVITRISFYSYYDVNDFTEQSLFMYIED